MQESQPEQRVNRIIWVINEESLTKKKSHCCMLSIAKRVNGLSTFSIGGFSVEMREVMYFIMVMRSGLGLSYWRWATGDRTRGWESIVFDIPEIFYMPILEWVKPKKSFLWKFVQVNQFEILYWCFLRVEDDHWYPWYHQLWGLVIMDVGWS